MQKKVALLHRHTPDRIVETNAAYTYLKDRVDTLTFKSFNRLSKVRKFWKSLTWIVYAPMLVMRAEYKMLGFWEAIHKGYDVIYCDDSYPFYPALVKLCCPHAKVVIRLGDFHLMYNYSGLAYHILHWFEKISWRMADEILVISEAMAEKLLSEGFVSVVVLDPVDPKDFPIKNTRRSNSVMFHGQITRNKNVDILLEAAKRLPEVPFDIVGDGPDLNRLKVKAPENVTFHGWIPFHEVYSYIATCGVGVALRSNNPGNEYVLTSPFLQYGVMGKPCLVTRRKVFGDYPWQFSGVDELVEKIKILLRKSEEGTKLREYILKHHDAQTIAEEIWDILMRA